MVSISNAGPSRIESPTALDLQVRAELLVNRGNEVAAVDLYELAVEAHSTDLYLKTRLAELLVNSGDLTAAERHLGHVLNWDPTYEFGWLVLAKLRAALGGIEQAVAAARYAMMLEPKSQHAAQWLAAFYLKNGDSIRSAEVYRRVLSLDRANPSALLGMGTIYRQQDDWPRAMLYFEAYCQFNPQTIDAVERIAEMEFDAGHLSRAADLYGLIVETDPTHVAAKRQLIGILLTFGAISKAAEQLKSLPQPDEADPAQVGNFAQWLFDCGQLYQARDLLINYIDDGQTALELKLLLARIEIELKRDEAARELLIGRSALWPPDLEKRRQQLLELLQSKH